MSEPGEAGERAKTLLRMSSWTKKPAIQAAPMLVGCQVRPLSSQQEEAMKAREELLLGEVYQRF
jgi:hypothetical protein